MKKRILYISDYDPHIPYSGIGIRGTHFVNFLAKHYHLDLVYMEGSGHPGDPKMEKTFAKALTGVDKKIKIPFSKYGYFIYSKKIERVARDLLKEREYDYLLADYGLSARYGYVLSKKYHIPFIYNSGNVEFRQYWGKVRTDLRRLPLVPYVYWVEKKGCKKAAILVACSVHDAEFYSRWVPMKDIIVVPQGFNEDTFNPFYKPVKNSTKIVLFFGDFNTVTNVQAVRAIRDVIADDVVARIPKIKFQFVGANPPKDIAHSHFEYTGFVHSLLPYIQKANLVISPMLKGWGMPTKVVESLACGKHVIATEVGARAVPREYRRLTVCNIKEFADKICNALEENNPVDACDYEAIKRDFSWTRRLEALRERIDNS